MAFGVHILNSMKNGVQYASFETKRCPMSDDICAAKVIEHIASLSVQPFTVADAFDLVESKCGRFTRGKTPGALRGWASITICTVGGWMRRGYDAGHVVYPGTLVSVRISDYNDKIYLEIGR